jgi:hypothetical protein
MNTQYGFVTMSSLLERKCVTDPKNDFQILFMLWMSTQKETVWRQSLCKFPLPMIDALSVYFTLIAMSVLYSFTPRPSYGVRMCRVRLYAGDPSLRSNHKHGYRQLGTKRKFDTVYVNHDMAPLRRNFSRDEAGITSTDKKMFCGRNQF